MPFLRNANRIADANNACCPTLPSCAGRGDMPFPLDVIHIADVAAVGCPILLSCAGYGDMPFPLDATCVAVPFCSPTFLDTDAPGTCGIQPASITPPFQKEWGQI